MKTIKGEKACSRHAVHSRMGKRVVQKGAEEVRYANKIQFTIATK